jgi:pimeloyl-ACP methyl ester carboxylesterase
MEERKVNVDYHGLQIEIAIRNRVGGEDSIIFLHGLGCCQDAYNVVWTHPGFDEYSILTFDQVGHGSSGKPEEFSYDMAAQADVCKLLIEKLGLECIHIVGHSMGGGIALLLIDKMLNKTKSFTNLEGNLIRHDSYLSGYILKKYTYEDFKIHGFDEIIEEISISKDKNSQLVASWVERTEPYSFYRSSESLVEWSNSNRFFELFMNLDLPKIYVFGDQNADLPVLQKLGRKLKTVSISNSGHFMMLDNPQEFYNKVLQFIKRST